MYYRKHDTVWHKHHCGDALTIMSKITVCFPKTLLQLHSVTESATTARRMTVLCTGLWMKCPTGIRKITRSAGCEHIC